MIGYTKTCLTVVGTVLLLSCAPSGTKSPVGPLLLEQLKNTHTDQNWFVPTKTALAGLDTEQANWKDETENHSIREITSHLIFWNAQNLSAFQEEPLPGFTGENATSFKMYATMDWEGLTNKLDSIQTAWETATANATQGQLDTWSSEIANMAAHTAYHTGQIVYIRKRKGWWE